MKLYLLAVAAIAATNVAAFPQQYTDPNQSATQVDAGLTGGDGYANTGGQEIQKAPATSGASCSDYKADGYECVPYYQCEDGEIIDDGAGLIDIRNGFLDPESSKCPNYIEECCRLPDYYEPVTARPVDCIWGEYSWGECDKTCGGGQTEGVRKYAQLAENGGQECSGDFTTVKSCNDHECPPKIDCAWSQYSWGECDKQCGGGYQTGTRTIARQADGGSECVGEAQTTRSCNNDPCPVDCEWGDFTWGPCSQTCGSGTKEGSRTVTTYQAYGGGGCTGPEKRTVKCNIGDCPPEPQERRCGERNRYGIQVGGVNQRIMSDPEKWSTQFGEWPNMCAVLQDVSIAGETYKGFVCGGSLVAPNVVLTAAHCVERIATEKLTVRCGEWDTTRTEEPLEHQDRRVVIKTSHPLFNNKSLAEDFATLHVDREFILSAHINTACLWDGDSTEIIKAGCVATGWGRDQWGDKGRYQVVLKQVELDLVDNYQCQEALRTKTDIGRRFRLHDSFVCAGGKAGVDTCRGDGGSPLMCPLASDPDTYVQTGIVAWGKECGKEGVPGVYASIEKAECFIKWSMSCRDDHVELPSYCHGFLDAELVKYETERARYADTLDNAPEGALRRIDRLRLEGKIKKVDWFLGRIHQALNECTALPSNLSNPYTDPSPAPAAPAPANPYPRGPGNPALKSDEATETESAEDVEDIDQESEEKDDADDDEEEEQGDEE